MKALAIDLGGTHARCAMVEDQAILRAKTLEADGTGTLAGLLPRVADAFRELLREAGWQPNDFAGLAFSSCGLVDSSAGRFLSAKEKWTDAEQADVPAWCRREFSLPMKLENDARMALLGEWYAGSGRGFDSIVMMTLGTGIGGAAMIEGKLLRGKHFQAGNLGGHQTVQLGGRKCMCGNIGCAEAEAAGWSLPLVAREWPGFAESALAREPRVDFEALFRLAQAGDSVAGEIRDRCLHVWAAAAVGLVHAFDPEVVIVGGGIMKSSGAILPFLRDYVRSHTWTPWGRVEVRAAALGNDAALLGAIPLLSA